MLTTSAPCIIQCRQYLAHLHPADAEKRADNGEQIDCSRKHCDKAEVELRVSVMGHGIYSDIRPWPRVPIHVPSPLNNDNVRTKQRAVTQQTHTTFDFWTRFCFLFSCAAPHQVINQPALLRSIVPTVPVSVLPTSGKNIFIIRSIDNNNTSYFEDIARGN